MKSMLLTYLTITKRSCKKLMFLPAFLVIASIITKSIATMYMGVAIFCIYLMMTLLVTLQKWYMYAFCFPIKRRIFVGSTYLFMMIFNFIAVSCVWLISVLLHEIVFTEVIPLLVPLFVFLAVTLLITIFIPFAYQLGVEKARYIYMLFILIPFIKIKLGNITITDDFFTMSVYLAIPIIVILLLFSYLISCMIMHRKSFDQRSETI